MVPSLCGVSGVPVPNIQYTHACDWGTHPHDMLVEMANEFDQGSSCVFRDIADRLDPAAKKMLAELAPEKGCSAADGVKQNSLILDFLLRNKDWALPPGASSY
eukprot:6938578-Alexandrium_andersonii.AAC.1